LVEDALVVVLDERRDEEHVNDPADAKQAQCE